MRRIRPKIFTLKAGPSRGDAREDAAKTQSKAGGLRIAHVFLMARSAEGDQILGSVIAQSAPPQNVMDLKIFHPPTRLATPTVSLQHFTAKLTISFRIKSSAWPFGAHSGHSVTRTF
jgi:hypothetical protein